jgi:hypothetical protein
LIQQNQQNQLKIRQLETNNAILVRQVESLKVDLLRVLDTSLDILEDWDLVYRSLLHSHHFTVVHSKNLKAFSYLRGIFKKMSKKQHGAQYNISADNMSLLYSVLISRNPND